MSDEEDEEKMRKEIENYRKQIGKTKAGNKRRFKMMIDYMNSDEDDQENENDYNESSDKYENNEQLNEKVEKLLKESQNEYNNINDEMNFDNNNFLTSGENNNEEIEADKLLEEIKKSCLNENKNDNKNKKIKKGKKKSFDDSDEEKEEDEEDSEKEEESENEKERKNKDSNYSFSEEKEEKELQNFLNEEDEKKKKSKLKKGKIDKNSDKDYDSEDKEDNKKEEESEDEESEEDDSEDDIEAFRRWKRKQKLKKQKLKEKQMNKNKDTEKKNKFKDLNNHDENKDKNNEKDVKENSEDYREKKNRKNLQKEKKEKINNILKQEYIGHDNIEKENEINSKNILRGKKSKNTKKEGDKAEDEDEDFKWNYINNKRDYNGRKDEKNNMKQTSNDSNNKNNCISEEDKSMDEKILSEIMQKNPGVKFSDIIGMNDMKQTLYEIIVIPIIRPDLFTGIRKPQRGILLFGPPGTGKTLIAKAISSECKSTFFNISSSSITSKWVGESEKTVKSLFKIAYQKSPSIIFIDDIDSILSKRNESENEAMKRLKTEFLIQFDGLGSNSNAKLLVIAATNRPMDLDEALLRRLPKRIYCNPLDEEGRFLFIKKVINRVETNLNDEDIKDIAKKTNNYSNSDLMELCREAAYEPVREKTMEEILNLDKFRPLVKKDLENAVKKIRPSLNKQIIDELFKWNSQFGGI